jgi:hypothetical protein
MSTQSRKKSRPSSEPEMKGETGATKSENKRVTRVTEKDVVKTCFASPVRMCDDYFNVGDRSGEIKQ